MHSGPCVLHKGHEAPLAPLVAPPAAAALALFAGTATAEARTPEARPALWAVSDTDTTIYLFGTIHLLPKDIDWRGAASSTMRSPSRTIW